MTKHLLALLAAIGLVSSQAPATVPSSLAGSAKRSPLELVGALAAASVPAGLEIRHSDDVLPSPWPPAFRDSKRRVPIADVLAAFNAARQDYRGVAAKGGVVVLRPADGRLPFLDQGSTIPAGTTVTGVMAAARRVFSQLDPALTGAVAGSGSMKGAGIRIALDGSDGRTVLDTLNQIAVQAPGHAWVITTVRERDATKIAELGFIHGDGTRDRLPMQVSVRR
jgi:hypothetical protein